MGTTTSRQRQALVAVLVGLASLYIFVTIGAGYIQDWQLQLGSLNVPTPRHALFAFTWTLFGGVAAIALTWGIAIGIADREFKVRTISDRSFLIAATLLAAIIPILLRVGVLGGAPLVDDASAYQFSAELLAQGQLTGESHAEKLFFDRQFMINDGRIYSQYFLGWPALMVPGVWLGISGYMNAFYAALTVVPLFWSVRRLAGGLGARVTVAIYLVSPMLMIGAATQMSHTTCICALAWLIHFTLRARDDDAKWPIHVAVSVAFCVAFFIRPLSAAAAGLPLLIYWAIGAWRLGGAKRIGAAVAFALPAIGFGAAFLAINAIQNGSPVNTAYGAARDYAIANGFRFSGFRGDGPQVTSMSIGHGIVGSFSMAGLGLMRLSTSLFGWPFSFLLAVFAFSSSKARLMWLSALSFVVAHSFLKDPGVDTFGPVHFSEVGLPILILSGIGFASAKEKLADFKGWCRAPMVATCVLIALSTLFYSPARLGAVGEISSQINRALDAPEREGLKRVVVFASLPFAPFCPQRSRGWVLFRPNNDPDLENDVLWVNHLSVERDKAFHAKYTPDREARILVWNEKCESFLIGFAQAEAINLEAAPEQHLRGMYAPGQEPPANVRDQP